MRQALLPAYAGNSLALLLFLYLALLLASTLISPLEFSLTLLLVAIEPANLFYA